MSVTRIIEFPDWWWILCGYTCFRASFSAQFKWHLLCTFFRNFSLIIHIYTLTKIKRLLLSDSSFLFDSTILSPQRGGMAFVLGAWWSIAGLMYTCPLWLLVKIAFLSPYPLFGKGRFGKGRLQQGCCQFRQGSQASHRLPNKSKIEIIFNTCLLFRLNNAIQLM